MNGGLSLSHDVMMSGYHNVKISCSAAYIQFFLLNCLTYQQKEIPLNCLRLPYQKMLKLFNCQKYIYGRSIFIFFFFVVIFRPHIVEVIIRLCILTLIYLPCLRLFDICCILLHSATKNSTQQSVLFFFYNNTRFCCKFFVSIIFRREEIGHAL